MNELKLGKVLDFILDATVIEVAIDVLDMSEDLKQRANKMIELEKTDYIRRTKEICDEHPGVVQFNRKWSNEPVKIMDACLWITLKVGEPLACVVTVGFVDAIDEFLESCVDLGIDFSNNREDIFKVVENELNKIKGELLTV